MLKLTNYEQEILDGKCGRLKQVAMENVVSYANVLSAEELCEITKATVFCGAHNYLNVCKSNDPDEVFSKMNLGKDNEIIKFDTTYENCYVQSCVSVCDQYSYEPFNQSKELFEKNQKFIDIARDAGVTIAGTCSPYLTGWLPIKGEHFVTTESGVTIIGNSIWDACCNSDGIEAAFWSAICGRTPKWGFHLEENRRATHHVKIETNLDTITDWDILGKALGKKLPAKCIPVISGNFNNVNFNKLRQFMTSLTINSDCKMCHVAGITPQARTVEDAFKGNKCQGELTVTHADMIESYNEVCSLGSADIDFVSLGCPHYDIDRIKKVSQYLKNKKIHKNVHFMIWTVYPIKYMSDINGYTKIIEEAGGYIYTSTCPGTIGSVFLKNYKNLVFDSLKKSISVKNMIDNDVFYGDTDKCLEAAITGRWEKTNRWTY